MKEGSAKSRALSGLEATSTGTRTLRRRVLREDIRDSLVEDILNGRLQPGARIVETHIARQFGVSQGPVREALRDLEILGFVIKAPFRGTQVRQVSREELAEIYPVRAALEGVAAGAAAKRLDKSTLARLEELLARMLEAASRADGRAQVEADIAFHKAIVEASGNQLLVRFWEAMRLETTTFLTIVVSHRSLRELAERHVPLLAALRAGDPALAQEVMRRHIEEPKEWIRAEIVEAELTNQSAGDGLVRETEHVS
jgi:DNA-binding GntR family transcriptional regulator